VTRRAIIWLSLLAGGAAWLHAATRAPATRRAPDSNLAAHPPPAPAFARADELQRVIASRPAPSDADPGQVCVKGRVVDSRSGAPIAEAEVSLRSGDEVVGSEKSDEGGSFSITCTDEKLGKLGDELHLEAEADTYAVARLPLSADAIGADPGVTLRLDAFARVSGTVVDERGSPVQGLWVRSACDDEEGLADGTDADGKFEIDEVPPGEHVFFVYESIEVTRLAAAHVRVAAGERRELRLVLGRQQRHLVRGRVVDLEGRPLPGILVTTRPLAAPVADPRAAALRAVAGTVTTDLDGAFEAEVARGVHAVELRHPADNGLLREAQLLAAPDPGATPLVVAQRAIQCTLVDAGGRAIPAGYFAIEQRGKDGKALPGEARLSAGGEAIAINFLWRPTIASIEVEASGANGERGALALTRADQPCVIRGAKPLASTTGSVGVPECDYYLARYQACIEQLIPEAGKQAMRSGMDQTREAWRKVAVTAEGRAALAVACKTAREAAAKATTAFDCRW
jgi:protocatechuate 3,4-dioxygenase beta subunit